MRGGTMKNFRYLLVLLVLEVASGLAQSTNSQNVGLPPNATFDGTGIENVQANNGNLHIEIPLYSLPGRGLPVQVSYVYDSKGWWGWTVGSDSPEWVKPAQDTLGGQPTQQWRISAPLIEKGGVLTKVLGKCPTGTA